MATPMGPTYAGGSQPIVHGGYSVLYLPDVNNAELQDDGEAPIFYWVPNRVRMARKDGPDSGDFLFSCGRFAGTGGDGVIGAGGEVAGGVLSFSVTGALPDDVRTQAEAEITARFQGSDDPFWGIRSQRPPTFRPAVIASNTTTVSNVSPTQRGFPVPADSGAGASQAIGTASTSLFARHDGRRALAARKTLRRRVVEVHRHRPQERLQWDVADRQVDRGARRDRRRLEW